MSRVHILDHPLIQHKMTQLRDVRTGNKEFRELVEEVAMLMVYEVTRAIFCPVWETPGTGCLALSKGEIDHEAQLG